MFINDKGYKYIEIGDKFGHLTIIAKSKTIYYPNSKKQSSMKTWLCECDCRNHTILQVRDGDLKSGKTRSCQHCKDIWIGDTYNHLTVVDIIPGFIRSDGVIYSKYRCMCDCAEHNIIDVASGSKLRTGEIKSCGKCKGFGGYMYLAPNYFGMIDRCYNINNTEYHRYGGRGIYVCNEWLNDYNGFINFRNWALSNGYMPGLKIDRINNDEPYYPENCRWADDITQANNRENTNKFLFNNEYHSIPEIARATGISKYILYDRNSKNEQLIQDTDIINGVYFTNEFGYIINKPEE